MRRLSLIAAVLAALVGAARAGAATYYVGAAGSDANAGTSNASPWRTVGRVNAARLAPGDTVLFEGGATFTDATLMPASSGAAGAPITFGSYGSGNATISNGKGAVWVSGRNYLTFDRLTLTTGGAAYNIFGGDSGNPSTNITLSNSIVTNGGATGVIAPSRGDSNWTLANDTITNTGDSAVILLAGDSTVRGSRVANVGTNPSITWSTHGIYAKGPNITVANNDISQVPRGQAVSIRFHGARVYGNAIHDTPYAFAFFDYDTAAAPQGTSYVYSNRLWNITGYGFYYDGQLDPQGRAPSVDFVIASNTFVFANASEAVNVSPSGSARVTLANNIFAGSYSSGLRAASTTAATYNNWYGGASNIPSRTGDLLANPLLGAAPGLALSASSPVVDAGTTAAGLPYTGDCTAAPLSYCGAAPDLGAAETAVAVPVVAPVPPAAPAPPPAPAPPAAPVPPAAPISLAVSSVTASGLTLTWKPGDARPVAYVVSRDGARIGTTSATSYAVSGLACGVASTYTVTAFDANGAGSAAASVSAATAACADTAAPTGRLLAPAAGSTVPRTFAISATASDAGSGVASLTFYVDGNQKCVVATTATYACTVTVAAGAHNVSIAMKDRAGNVGWLGATVTASKNLRTLASKRRR